MQFTGIGYILFCIGLYAFCFNQKFLYNLTIFFIPFSATAIINIGSGENFTAIQPYMFFGSLWIISFLFSSMVEHKTSVISINNKEYKILLFLFLFAIIALMSLLMPIYIDGREMGNITGTLAEEEQIRFSSTNITQYFYLFLGITFSICIYNYNKSVHHYKHTIQIVYYSILFVIIWGGIEYFFKSMGLPPLDILNTSAHGAAGGYLSVMTDEMLRIASVTVEPSIFVQVVVLILPFIIVGILNKKYINKKYFDCFYLFLAVLVIVLSASSSGLFALIILCMLIFILRLHKLSFSRKLLYGVFFTFIFFVFVLFIYLFLRDLLQAIVFDKSESYSAMERLGNIIQAWINFKNYPLLGVGWGSVTSMDLVVKLLSNTGIMGFTFFSIYLFVIGRNLIKCKKGFLYTEKFRDAIFVSFILLIVLSEIAGFSFMFGHTWLFLGLSMITVFREDMQTDNLLI